VSSPESFDLIVVVDPDYGARLDAAAEIGPPVWVVESTANLEACESIWSAQRSVTCYHVADTKERLTNLIGVLPALQEHHGEIRDDRFGFPNGFVLGVLGLAPTANVETALEEFGFDSCIEIPDGFKACKRT